ncbi:hypothetical protein N7486_004537, partial [Penicillium sp. IBT 16267x]
VIMDVTHLIEILNATAETLPSLEESERRQLLQACDKLKNKLETPFNLASRLIFSGHQAIALRLGIDLKLFDAIAAKAGRSDGPVKIYELVEETSAEPLLIMRIMRFLAAMSVVQEVCPGSYNSPSLAAALVSSSPLSAAMIHGPYYQQAFNNTTMAMSFRRRGKDWFDVFPVADRLRVPGSADPLLVDIGGGQGEDLKKFKTRFPTMPGKLFLQDLPAVAQGAQDLPAGIEVQSHDFFQVQPVKNAKVYFMRTVLHDWPDKQAAQILGRVRDAMDTDSILLISETMLPESGALLSSVLSDMQMMGSFASLERTEAQWRALLEQAGLELVQTWLPDECDGSAESLAEQPALFEARKGLKE